MDSVYPDRKMTGEQHNASAWTLYRGEGERMPKMGKEGKTTGGRERKRAEQQRFVHATPRGVVREEEEG